MSNRKNTTAQIKKLTVSAMLCALGVIILALGTVIEVIDLSVSVIASLLCIYAVIEIGGFYPWLIWLVTSVVSLLLLSAQPTPVVFYALLTGYYPILKEKLERIPRVPSYLLKWLVATLASLAIYAVARLFIPALLEGYNTLPLLLVLYVGLMIVFFLYDFCLSGLISFYFRRLRPRLRIHK